MLAGLLAGLVLGVSAVIVSLLAQGSALLPFRFATAFVVGPVAFEDAFPAASAILLGLAIHFSLSAIYGIVFVGALALLYQLSARSWLLVIYGAVFGFTVWEVNFLAAVPAVFPFLAGRLDVPTQVWNGLVSYVLIYGPVLAVWLSRTTSLLWGFFAIGTGMLFARSGSGVIVLINQVGSAFYGPVLAVYVARVRPGVVGDWHAVGPPAGTWRPPGQPPDERQGRG